MKIKNKKELTKILSAGALVLNLAGGLSSFQPQDKMGKVTKESGDVLNIVESNERKFVNESRKDNPIYVLSVDTESGEYTIYVSQDYSKPIEALAVAIDVGDIIRFRTNSNKNISYFSQDRIGKVPSSTIELIEIEAQEK